MLIIYSTELWQTLSTFLIKYFLKWNCNLVGHRHFNNR